MGQPVMFDIRDDLAVQLDGIDQGSLMEFCATPCGGDPASTTYPPPAGRWSGARPGSMPGSSWGDSGSADPMTQAVRLATAARRRRRPFATKKAPRMRANGYADRASTWAMRS